MLGWLALAIALAPSAAAACGACTDAVTRVEDPGLLDVVRVCLAYAGASVLLRLARAVTGGAVFRLRSGWFGAAWLAGVAGSLLLGGSGTGAALVGGLAAAAAAIHRLMVVARLDRASGFERAAAALAALFLVAALGAVAVGRAGRSDPERLIALLRGMDPGTVAAHRRLAALDGYQPALAQRLVALAAEDLRARELEATALALLWADKGGAPEDPAAVAAAYTRLGETAKGERARAAAGWALGRRAPAALDVVGRGEPRDAVLLAYGVAGLEPGAAMPAWACTSSAALVGVRAVTLERLDAPSGFAAALDGLPARLRAGCGGGW